MRITFNIFLIITPLLLFVVSCNSPKRPADKELISGKPTEKKGSGKIVFDKEIHNFGTLKDREIVSYSFVFRIDGGSPVKIVGAETSCGCLDIKYDTNFVLPGKPSTVEVVFNTAGEWGNQVKGVTIRTSAGEEKELQIGAYIENKQFNNYLKPKK